MIPKKYFQLAQVLGLLPAQGLWNKSEDTKCHLQVKAYSLQILYSMVTLILRMSVKLTFMYYADSPRVIPCKTDLSIARICFITTFWTGSIYQVLSLYRTKQFLLFLKKLREYDLAWPKLTKPKYFCHFFIHNSIFLFAVIAFPASLAVGVIIFSKHDMPPDFHLGPPFHGFEEKGKGNYERDIWYQLLVISVTFAVSFLSEAASFFPILQLSYFVRMMEHRLSEICGAVEEHVRTSKEVDEQYDALAIMHKSDKKLWAQLSLLEKEGIFGKAAVKKAPFWREMTRRYLHFSRVYASFSKFSEIYFLLLYPMQILSCVSIIYLTLATPIFHRPAYVNIIFKLIIGMSLLRIWSMCNLGNGLEVEHDRLMRKALAQNVVKLEGRDEKVQYERFLLLVKSIPMQLDAGGYFTVGRGNIPGVITAVVSYLIVLFQFKAADMFPSSGMRGGGGGGGFMGGPPPRPPPPGPPRPRP